VLHHPRVDAAIIGPRNAAQLEAAFGSTAIGLSDEDAPRLTALFETGAARP
jgi:aryl-alcohol dehydrogenase-like predicted oxidoreductase